MSTEFWQTQPPYFYCTGVSSSDITDFGYSLLTHDSRDLVVRFIRGAKMSTIERMHNEIGAVLQFPWYYGENWAALDECINDLEWLPGKAYILIFTDAEQLLAEEDDELLGIFIRVLHNAAAEWNGQVDSGSQMRSFAPFHVIFQSSDSERFTSRLQRVGFSCTQLELNAR